MSKSTLNCLACGTSMGQGSTCGRCGWTYNSVSNNDDSVDRTDDHHRTNGDTPIATSSANSSSAPSASLIETRTSLIRSDSDLWWEVTAVLAVGVIPYLPGIFGNEHFQKSSVPYWVDFTSLFVQSTCAMYVTLYLIHRSGESWERFGITRFCVSDLFLGFFLMMVAWVVYVLWWQLPGEMRSSHDELYPVPRTRLDFVLMIVGYVASGLSEEVVTRGYLITRLERLFRSSLAAVLVAAALFASYHLYQGLDGAFHALLFGLTYGVAFLWFRSVWPLTIGHALINIYRELLWSG